MPPPHTPAAKKKTGSRPENARQFVFERFPAENRRMSTHKAMSIMNQTQTHRRCIRTASPKVDSWLTRKAVEQRLIFQKKLVQQDPNLFKRPTRVRHDRAFDLSWPREAHRIATTGRGDCVMNFASSGPLPRLVSKTSGGSSPGPAVEAPKSQTRNGQRPSSRKKRGRRRPRRKDCNHRITLQGSLRPSTAKLHRGKKNPKNALGSIMCLAQTAPLPGENATEPTPSPKLESQDMGGITLADYLATKGPATLLSEADVMKDSEELISSEQKDSSDTRTFKAATPEQLEKAGLGSDSNADFVADMERLGGQIFAPSTAHTRRPRTESLRKKGKAEGLRGKTSGIKPKRPTTLGRGLPRRREEARQSIIAAA